MTIPARIGPYLIERRLGGGGMAEVFLANLLGEEGFSRPVAIKRVLRGFENHPDFAALFTSEAKLSARLHHPNIVSVLDFKRDAEHGLFLVMELVDGKDLSQLLATGMIPVPLAIHLSLEILRGLGYAHNLPMKEGGILGIIHRDISPQNILLSWGGAVKISDFGISKPSEAAQAPVGVMIKGKPAYMSPEQAEGKPLDGRSDLFAVGVMLWEMLTGEPLFRGGSTMEILAALLRSQILSPKVLRPDLSGDVCSFVMRLLAKEREERYATAEAAMRDLWACQDAPRDGSTELTTILQARFLSPSRAPTIVEAPLPRVRIGASRPSRTLTLGGWAIPKLWLLFVAVLLSVTVLIFGASAIATEDEPWHAAPLADPVPVEQPPELAASPVVVPPTAVVGATSAAAASPLAPAAKAPAVIVPSGQIQGTPARGGKRSSRKPSPAPPAEAAPAPSGIIEVQF